MRVNLRDAFVLDHYEKTIEFSLSVEGDEALEALADFSEKPRVSFSIRGKYGLVMCDTVIDLQYESFCGRCLSSVQGELHIENSRRMITDPLKEDEGTILIAENMLFDPEEEAKNQIVLEFPVRFLCKEDCKGLCPVCGCNLNEETCACGCSE